MERLYSELKSNGEDIHTSMRNRLTTRPTGLGSGQPFENLGGTLKPASQRKDALGNSKPSSQASSRGRPAEPSKFKPAVRPRPPSPMPKVQGSSGLNVARSRSNSVANCRAPSSQSTRPPPSSAINVSSDSDLSNDEIDLLSSQTNDEDDPSSWSKPVSKPSKPKASISKTRPSKASKDETSAGVFIDSEGRTHQYNHKYPPSKESAIGKLKFKKVKKDEIPVGITEPPAVLPSAFPPTMPQETFFQEGTSDWPEGCISVKDSAGRAEVKHVSPLGTKCVKSNRTSSPPSQPHMPLPTIIFAPSSTSANAASQEHHHVGPPRGRPRPRPLHKSATTTAVLQGSQIKNASNKINGFESENENPITHLEKERPKPRPLHRASTNASGLHSKKDWNAPSSSQSTSNSSLTKILDKVVGGSRSRSRSIECSSPQKTRPDGFPAITPPISSKRDPFAYMSPLETKEQFPSTSKVAELNASPSRLPRAFPMAFTPTKSKDEEDELITKPRLRPSRVTAKDRNKGKAKSSSDADDDDGDIEDDDYDDYKSKSKRKVKERKKKATKPKAFPMSTQVLASIDTRDIPSSSPLESSRCAKRSSEATSEEDRVFKKSKMKRELLQESPNRHIFDDEGDSLLMTNADPNTLCPYCDLPLPSSPSPLLLKLLATTKKKSQRDPRPYNPLGLKAPLTTFISVCQRHRFESQILPEAEKKGWPKKIEWEEVGSRVMNLYGVLKALIEDPGDDVTLEGGDAGDEWEVGFTRSKGKGKKAMKGPKARCRFWVEVLNEIKKKGLRAVSGVRGQFANFEKMQPGYYGEMGSVIIHQTLYNMFPLDSINSAFTAPLTANEFIERILVPEVALRLIMEDKGLDNEMESDFDEAMEILRDSSSYGVAMFPEDGGEWDEARKRKTDSKDDEDHDKMGVGDLIVMERARKRRIELEEEDEKEQAQLRKMEEKQFQETNKERDKERRKKKLAAKQSVDLPKAPDPAVERPKPRPRPRPLMKNSSGMSVLDPSTELGQDQNQLCSSRSRSRSRSNSVASDNNCRRPSSQERRRSPSASESRTLGQIPASPRFSRFDYEMDLGHGCDSDASSNKATVDGGGDGLKRRGPRTRAGSGSSSRSSSMRPHLARVDKSAVSKSVDDDVVEISELLDARTPRQAQKARFVVDVDEEATPKASAPSLPPLEAARRRGQRNRQESKSSDTGGKTGLPPLGMTRKVTKAPTWGHESSVRHARLNEPTQRDASPKNPEYKWLLDD